MKKVWFVALLLIVAASSCVKKERETPKISQTSTNLYKMEEGFVDCNGVMIYYKTLGKGEPLMIVHGGPGASHEYLLPYLLPLARTNKLIFIDERGSGRSSGLEDPSGYT